MIPELRSKHSQSLKNVSVVLKKKRKKKSFSAAHEGQNMGYKTHHLRPNQ